MTALPPSSSWFGRCRDGMFVHADIATVPAFAPRHEHADRYWAFRHRRDHAMASERLLDLDGNDLDGDTWVRPA